MEYQKKELLYEGKAKKIFSVEGDENLVWMNFKDDLTAFNAEKRGEFSGKGKINLEIATRIFIHLKKEGVASHWVASPSPVDMVCERLEIIPLEVVVRNVMAGSTAKRLGFEEGYLIKKPLVEFYYKKDELSDPFISDDQALLLEAAKNQEELNVLKQKALQVNQILSDMFAQLGVRLIDFKLEFGKNSKDDIVLGDEITPDSCRLWDTETQEKLDKDRFRRDLGKVEESYAEVLNRMKQKGVGQ